MASSSSSTSLFHTSLRLPSPPVRSLAPSSLPLSRPTLAVRSPLRWQREPNRGRPSVRCKAGLVDQSAFGEEVLEADGFVLVEFVADWCGPCRLIGPVVDWVAKEYRDQLKVVKIDHDANPQLIEEYKVYGLPALILFKDGKEIPGSRREGAITKIKLKEVLDSFLETKTIS